MSGLADLQARLGAQQLEPSALELAELSWLLLHLRVSGAAPKVVIGDLAPEQQASPLAPALPDKATDAGESGDADTNVDAGIGSPLASAAQGSTKVSSAAATLRGRALEDELGWRRALHRLATPRAEGAFVVDVDATVHASAAATPIGGVLRPMLVRKRALRAVSQLLVVVDGAAQVEPWRSDVDAVGRLAERSARFRHVDVRVAELSAADVKLYAREDPKGLRAQSFADVVEDDRSIILIVSDGLSPAFVRGAFGAALAQSPVGSRAAWLHPWPSGLRADSAVGALPGGKPAALSSTKALIPVVGFAPGKAGLLGLESFFAGRVAAELSSVRLPIANTVRTETLQSERSTKPAQRNVNDVVARWAEVLDGRSLRVLALASAVPGYVDLALLEALVACIPGDDIPERFHFAEALSTGLVKRVDRFEGRAVVQVDDEARPLLLAHLPAGTFESVLEALVKTPELRSRSHHLQIPVNILAKAEAGAADVDERAFYGLGVLQRIAPDRVQAKRNPVIAGVPVEAVPVVDECAPTLRLPWPLGIERTHTEEKFYLTSFGDAVVFMAAVALRLLHLQSPHAVDEVMKAHWQPPTTMQWTAAFKRRLALVRWSFHALDTPQPEDALVRDLRARWIEAEPFADAAAIAAEGNPSTIWGTAAETSALAFREESYRAFASALRRCGEVLERAQLRQEDGGWCSLLTRTRRLQLAPLVTVIDDDEDSLASTINVFLTEDLPVQFSNVVAGPRLAFADDFRRTGAIVNGRRVPAQGDLGSGSPCPTCKNIVVGVVAFTCDSCGSRFRAEGVAHVDCVEDALLEVCRDPQVEQLLQRFALTGAAAEVAALSSLPPPGAAKHSIVKSEAEQSAITPKIVRDAASARRTSSRKATLAVEAIRSSTPLRTWFVRATNRSMNDLVYALADAAPVDDVFIPGETGQLVLVDDKYAHADELVSVLTPFVAEAVASGFVQACHREGEAVLVEDEWEILVASRERILAVAAETAIPIQLQIKSITAYVFVESLGAAPLKFRSSERFTSSIAAIRDFIDPTLRTYGEGWFLVDPQGVALMPRFVDDTVTWDQLGVSPPARFAIQRVGDVVGARKGETPLSVEKLRRQLVTELDIDVLVSLAGALESEGEAEARSAYEIVALLGGNVPPDEQHSSWMQGASAAAAAYLGGVGLSAVGAVGAFAGLSIGVTAAKAFTRFLATKRRLPEGWEKRLPHDVEFLSPLHRITVLCAPHLQAVFQPGDASGLESTKQIRVDEFVDRIARLFGSPPLRVYRDPHTVGCGARYVGHPAIVVGNQLVAAIVRAADDPAAAFHVGRAVVGLACGHTFLEPTNAAMNLGAILRAAHGLGESLDPLLQEVKAELPTNLHAEICNLFPRGRQADRYGLPSRFEARTPQLEEFDAFYTARRMTRNRGGLIACGSAAVALRVLSSELGFNADALTIQQAKHPEMHDLINFALSAPCFSLRGSLGQLSSTT